MHVNSKKKKKTRIEFMKRFRTNRK